MGLGGIAALENSEASGFTAQLILLAQYVTAVLCVAFSNSPGKVKPPVTADSQTY